MITDVTEAITDAVIDYLRGNQRARFVVSFFSINFGILAALLFMVVPNINLNEQLKQNMYTLGAIVAIVSGFGFLMALGATQRVHKKTETEEELEPIRQERKVLQSKIGSKNLDTIDTIKLNLNQLNEYYVINKSQAKGSFRASICAIVIGFATIVIGVWIFYLSDKPNNNLTYLSLIAGVILQFVGGAYFYMFNRSLQQLNYFFNKLTAVQDTMLSVTLVDRISIEQKKADMYEYIIREIVARNSDLSSPHWEARRSNSKSRKGDNKVKGPTKIQKVASAVDEVSDKKVA